MYEGAVKMLFWSDIMHGTLLSLIFKRALALQWCDRLGISMGVSYIMRG